MATKTQQAIKLLRKWGVEVYPRYAWGTTSAWRYQWRRVNRKHTYLNRRPSDTLVCHITVTHSSVPIKEAMRTLERIGNDRFDSGVSYNFGVHMRSGAIGLGQSLDAAGTHTLNDKNQPGFSFNQNYAALAFAFIGMPGEKPSEIAIKNAGLLVKALIQVGALTKGHDFKPHAFFAYKECPTQNVINVMPRIHQIALGN